MTELPRYATVRTWSPQTRDGQAVTDDGGEVVLTATAFDRSALRGLRPGQRVRLEWAGPTLTLVTVATLPRPLT